MKSILRLGYKIQLTFAVAALVGFVALVLLYDNEEFSFDVTRLVIAFVVLAYFGGGICFYLILRTKIVELSQDSIIITSLFGVSSRSYPYSDIENIKTKTLRMKGRVARGNPYEGVEIRFRDGFEFTFSENMYVNYKKIKLFIYSKVQN